MLSRPTSTFICWCFGVWTAIAPIDATRAATEYSIKAGYMLLFARNVEWPSSAFMTTNAPIVICILGADPFGSVLDRTLERQRAHERPLSVQRHVGVDAIHQCHVAFISSSEARNQVRWLAELADRPVLTVIEDPAALASGAAISFAADPEREQRVRFEVNLSAVQRAGLKMSAPMPAAALKVHREPAATRTSRQ